MMGQIIQVERSKFFDLMRNHFGSFDQQQVDGINELIGRIEHDAELTKMREWVAYALATAWWETGRTWRPIEEFGKGRGRPYGPRWYGRGYVQVTWRNNYVRLSRETGVDCVSDPSLALRPDVAYAALSKGMREGWYTGRKLANYIWVNPNGQTHADYLHARRIINGMDRADVISQQSHNLEMILRDTTTRVTSVSA